MSVSLSMLLFSSLPLPPSLLPPPVTTALVVITKYGDLGAVPPPIPLFSTSFALLANQHRVSEKILKGGKKKVLGFESGKEMCEPENTHLVAELVRVRVL